MTIESGAVDMAFRTALLLTGAAEAAEEAVIHGIGSCEDVSYNALLMETARSAIRRQTKPADWPYEVEALPAELRRLFKLRPLFRKAFVLRILVGLSPEVCAGLLDISTAEFQNTVCAALNELALLSFQEPTIANGRRASG